MEQKIEPFLAQYFKNKEFRIFALAGDASSRKYYRVAAGSESSVLMSWEPFEQSKYPFLSVLKHFKKHHVHVPEVLHFSEKEGLVLLEDLGDLTLERKFWESQNQLSALPFYKMSIDELIQIHFKSTQDKQPCTAFDLEFDTEKLLWEMNYGVDNLIKGVCQFKISEAAEKELAKCLKSICDRISAEPKYIVHRDYHSRNLMIKFDQIRVIDFQDARLGAVQYDLVSLLRDSYVNLNDEMVQLLLQDYLEKANPYLPKNFSREHFDEIFEYQTVQRCFKACGSFASFYNQRKDTRYLKYISQTLKRVLKSATMFSDCQPMIQVLLDSGAMERKYEVS